MKVVLADKVSTAELNAITAKVGKIDGDVANFKETTTEKLTAQDANIKKIDGDVANFKETTTEKLNANEANIKKIDGDVASFKETTTEKLSANEANIKKIDGDVASFKETTTEKFKANEASIKELKTGKLSAKDADLKYANIDFSNIGKTAMEYFYAQSGLVKDVKIGDATITGELVGVTISGDLLKGNTVVADKLVIKGSDGLYYKLNTDGMSVEKEQTDYNSLNGQVIRAKSITATKIDVDDLVAFGATIGGFKIGQDSIYSGVKESVGNTTRGIYMDNDGQFVFGDANQYVKFYKISEGKYKLAIAVEDLYIGLANVADAISDAKNTAENAAKTATNYMKFDNSGLTVGDLTKNTLGRNVNIDSSSVNIRNGTNVLAQFAESLIEIGKNTSTATISFLGGIVKLIGEKQTIEGTTFYDAHLLSTNMMTLGTGSTDPSSDKINSLISMNGMSGEREVLASVTDTQGHSTLTVLDSSASLYSDGDAGYSSVNVIASKSTSQVEIHANGSNGNRALINYSHAIQYYNNSTLLAAYNGQTPCLWDGFIWMRADQTATLSAPISQQPHGIIVIFALYDPTTGGVTNIMTNPYFVPKTAIDYDYIFTMFWENGWQAGVKRVTVKNTQIIGHDQNDSALFTASSALKLNQRYFVLRRVYGV